MDAKIEESFKGKNILVTGGTGLIGREVVKILCDFETNTKIASLDDINVDSRAEHIKTDLTDINNCLKITEGIDYVFHLAGIKGSIDVTKSKPASFLVPLLMFNTNILEASRLRNVKKLVYTSSIGAYSSAEIFVESENLEGPPMDMYPGWAKRIAELQIKSYAKQYGINWSIVRPCNVYGPGDNFDPDNAMVIPSLMMRILRKESPVSVWGDGSAIRDFAFSRDVAIGIVQALYYGTKGDFVNLGSGNGVTIKELLENLKSFIDFDFEFDLEKPSGFPRRVMDISRAKKWINYDPQTSLIDGLKETWNWFKSNQNEYLSRKNYFI